MKHENAFSRHGLFDARVPRYTSYPPANRFVPIADEATAAQWMRTVPQGEAVSFYMHVPFCRRLCWFCACRTQGTKTDGPVDNYVAHLQREITLAGARLNGVKAERIHIGGGTPTLLTPQAVETLMATFDAHFPRMDGAEFSVEIDPTEIDMPRLEALVAAGMNRASLGVQDFDPKVQESIGRLQSYAETAFCVDGLRELGVTNINLDILYGLPFQTLDTLNDTLDKVLALDPDRIAAFGYAHVPWMSRRQSLIPEDALPDPRMRLVLFDALAERLTTAGYIQIGIDHFVKPHDGLASALAEKRLHRNFQGYTDDASPWLIGLGASAISRYPQGYLHNATSTADYLARIADGHFATKRGIAMSGNQFLVAELIEQMMCYGRIEIGRLTTGTAEDHAQLRRKMQDLATEFAPFVTLSGDNLHVDKAAYPLLRILAARLDEETLDGSSHAVAV
ncbi:oxygen-independent coproporphyrinogen III oxidase [Aliishimia ponticola]|uniref:Coproporphyrinogen-III oxidase n=1 Tax=Aliishimia ponticola TaxID=2499833 RepID=A0A4S4NBM5_9RHOB|nr:oxygen-independent coproporphyrinogen III oxidase [Aliishimia ponticola]THH35867.1 oxygen-independent coproporphyrinogen III oxidase [Aliishimia ponticola]